MVATSLVLLAADLPDAVDPATAEDLQIVGHVLHFVSSQRSGALDLLVVYNANDPRSLAEASAINRLLSNGLAVDDLVLHPRMVSQANLATTSGYAAIMTAAGVEAATVRASMEEYHVPCLTTHQEQVKDGGCLVSIRSLPSVSIVLNGAAANAAGVRFATAFRMMVREL